ncbi:hypothetical protein PFISCL1PPCAC_12379, partial [Pristionchus fissidentatus]
ETLRGLPKEKREAGLDAVLKELKSKLSEETPFEEIEIERKLRVQSIRGRSVALVCEELEKWVDKVHEEEEKREIMKKRQLLFLYEGKQTEHLKLLEMFVGQESYEKMKAVLVQIEYLRRREKDSGNKGLGGQGLNGRKCHNCGGNGHMSANCVSPRFSQNDGSNNGRGGFRGSFGANRGGARGGFHQSQRGGYRPNASHGGNSDETSGDVRNNAPEGGAQSDMHASGGNAGGTNGAQRGGASRGGGQYGGYNRGYGRGGFNVRGINWEDERARKEKKIKEEEYFFIKKRKKVSGWLNGREAQILLDTGADVSVISRNTVEKIEGVEVLKGGTIDMCDVQGGKMDIVGRAVIQVELERGKVAPVEFYIVNNDRGTVIIGGMGLDALGIELKTVDYKEEERGLNKEGERDEGCEAMALRSMVVEPGEMGTVWVTGEPGATVVLNADVEQAVEGVAVNEAVVLVPIVNDTKRQNVCPRILRWAAELLPYQLDIIHVKGKENVVADSLSRFPVDSVEDKALEGISIGDDIVINAVTRRRAEEDSKRENELRVVAGETQGREKWRTAQGGDEWVKSVLVKWEESEAGKRKKNELIKMPDSTVKYSLADIVVDQGVMFILVNGKLREEKERMKALYDKRAANNKGFEPMEGNRVYVRKEKAGEKNPKLRI